MRRALMTALVIVVASTLSASAALQKPVRVSGGIVQGVVGDDPTVTSFLGVPYAAAPVGDLRWKAPQPVAPWKGVRHADKFGNACMQNPDKPGSFYQVEFREKGEPVSEDCLFLNLWTAASSASEKRPVMVWIHGGGFVGGSGSMPTFNGESFAKKGVVIVTINYRLGIFGFLAHPELTKESGYGASGNYGMLDQVEALKWVKANIQHFGGDPNNVTIFGQSAGAMSVINLTASPLAKGYFRRAIVQSGAFMTSGNLKTAEESGVNFARRMGGSSIAELRSKSAAEVQRAGVPSPNDTGANVSPALPIVDGYFLTKDPREVYEAGEENTHSLMVGSDSNEGTTLIPAVLTAEQVKRGVEKRYGDRSGEYFKLYPVNSDEEAWEASANSIRDNLADTALDIARFEHGRQKEAYVYYFDRRPPGRDSDHYGAYHSSELAYVFDQLDTVKRPWTEIDRKLADTMSSYWVNFAKTGNPNGTGLPSWPAFGATSYRGIELGNTVKPNTLPSTERLEAVERNGFRLMF